jgi:hypothetical protein
MVKPGKPCSQVPAGKKANSKTPGSPDCLMNLEIFDGHRKGRGFFVSHNT